MSVFNRIFINKNDENSSEKYQIIREHKITKYYFIGHSLDKIDNDFLIRLYLDTMSIVDIIIFYCNKNDRKDKLLNLYLLSKEYNVDTLLNTKTVHFENINNIFKYNFLN